MTPALYVAVHTLSGLIGALAGLAGIYLFFGTWPAPGRILLIGVTGSSLWGVIVGLGFSLPALRAARPRVPALSPGMLATVFGLPALFPCGLWLLIREARRLLF